MTDAPKTFKIKIKKSENYADGYFEGELPISYTTQWNRKVQEISELWERDWEEYSDELIAQGRNKIGCIFDDLFRYYLEIEKEVSTDKVKKASTEKVSEATDKASDVKASKLQTQNTLKELFSDVAKEYSYDNEEVDDYLFHLFMGAVFNKYGNFIKVGPSKLVSTKLHFWWIQDSTSGKSEKWRLIENLVNIINDKMKIKHPNTYGDGIVTVLSKQGTKQVYSEVGLPKFLHLYKMNEKDTIEGWINQYQEVIHKDGRKSIDINNIRYGDLSRADIIIADEGKWLMDTKNDIANALLALLGDDEWNKKVKKNNGASLPPNRGKFCFITSTRPDIEIKENLLDSGLVQRATAYFREISKKDRTNLDNKIVTKMFDTATNKINTQYNKKIDILTDKIIEVYEHMKNLIDYQLIDQQDLSSWLISNLNDEKVLLYQYFNEKKKQKLIDSFITRATQKILVVSVINAFANKTNKIDLGNIKIAYDLLIKKALHKTAKWISENVEMEFVSRHYQKDRAWTIKNIREYNKLFPDEPYLLSDYIKKFCSYTGVHRNNIRRTRIQPMETAGVIKIKKCADGKLNIQLIT